MVLGVYISNSGIRAAYLDQDGNPVQISLSAQSPKFVLKPSIFLEGEFAYTGEYVEKMLYLNPGLEHFSDLITELEKEYLKEDEHTWKGDTLFTLLCKYLLFKAKASVSVDFRKVTVSYPDTYHSKELSTISKSMRQVGLRFSGGMSHGKSIYAHLAGQGVISNREIALVVHVDNREVALSVVGDDVNEVESVLAEKFPFLINLYNKILDQIVNDYRAESNDNWHPSDIDLVRLKNVIWDSIRNYILEESDDLKSNLVIGNKVMTIQLSANWMSDLITEMSDQLLRVVNHYLAKCKLEANNVHCLFLHGTYAASPFLTKCLLQYNPDWSGKIYYDPDGTAAMEGLLQSSKDSAMGKVADEAQTEMPGFIKNVFVNNLSI